MLLPASVTLPARLAADALELMSAPLAPTPAPLSVNDSPPTDWPARSRVPPLEMVVPLALVPDAPNPDGFPNMTVPPVILVVPVYVLAPLSESANASTPFTVKPPLPLRT